MKIILHDLADLVSRASRLRADIEQLDNDARDLMRRIEFVEAKKLDVSITPAQMLSEIQERYFDIPLNLDSSPGRATATLGEITARCENMEGAITTLYKLIKYRELIWGE